MKSLFYFLIFIIEAICIFSLKPIAQDQSYHSFADTRSFSLVNNFFDVFSNLPFFLIGIVGLIHVYNNKKNLRSSTSWFFVFLGVLLVAPGSAFYHYNPNDFTLIWDRLPMTIGFMAITTALFSYNIKRRHEFPFLLLSLLMGFFSIWVWVQFDDLRLYFLVQLTPILFVPILAFTQSNLITIRKYLLLAFCMYFCAKISESYDHEIYSFFILSGHSIKHLFASVAAYYFYKIAKTLSSEDKNFY